MFKIFKAAVLRAVLFVSVVMSGVQYAGAGCFRILFENKGEVWDRAFMTYWIYNEDGTAPEDRTDTVELEHVGGPFWFCELQAPSGPHQLFFSDGNGRQSHIFNGFDSRVWNNDICFNDVSTSNLHYDSKQLVFFEFIDRNGWMRDGADGLLTDVFYAEDGTLFDVWARKELEAEPDVYLLDGGAGRSVSGCEGPVYRFALVNGTEKTPCVWLRRADMPSNAIVSPVHDGAVLSQYGDDCAFSVYASCQRKPNPDGSPVTYDMDGMAVPFRDGAYSLEWRLPANMVSQIAFTLTPGNDSFVAGALRPVADEAGGIGKHTAAGVDYHIITTGPDDAQCRFVSNAAMDPTVEYSNTSGADLRAEVSVRFDAGSRDGGVMAFSALPVCPLEVTPAQMSEDGLPSFGLTLGLRWTGSGAQRLKDGRTALEALKALRLSAADSRVTAELSRAAGIAADASGSLVIDSPEFMTQLSRTGSATISFPLVRPDLDYCVTVWPVPADDVPADEWRAFGFGIPELHTAASRGLRMEPRLPSLTPAGIRCENVEVPEDVAAATEFPCAVPYGAAKPTAGRAARLNALCSLSGLLPVPEGWTAFYRIIAADGSIIAETVEPEISISGLSPDDRHDLSAVAVYSSADGEMLSGRVWRPSEILTDGLPIFNSLRSEKHIILKAQDTYPSDIGNVYDAAFEFSHDIENRNDIPLCLSVDITAGNAAAHSGHIAAGRSGQPRLMAQTEHYRDRDGATWIEGNGGVSPQAKDWPYSIASNGRTAFYIHHFHCDKPGQAGRAASPAGSTTVTATCRLLMPVLVSGRPVVGSGAGNTAENSGRLTFVTLPLDGEEAPSATLEVSLDGLDKIATGNPGVTVSEQDDPNVYDLSGRRLQSIPDRGFFIRNNAVNHR